MRTSGRRSGPGGSRGVLAATLAIAACFLGGCATGGDPYFLHTKTKATVFVAPGSSAVHKVAVMPFKAPTELIGTSVSDLFVTELLRAGHYQLVERGQMSQVLSEAELALAGLSAAKAAEVGGMLGADGVIIGTVSEYTSMAQRGRTYPVVAVAARLIECGSGRIVWSVDLASRAETSSTSLSAHSRKVVHDMASAVYQELMKAR